MRRLFLTLLLVILPMQFSWAVHSAYCTGDVGAQLLDSTIHEQNQSVSARELMESGVGTLADSADDCHHCDVTAVVFPDMASLASRDDGFYILASWFAYRSHIPLAPDRPNWGLSV